MLWNPHGIGLFLYSGALPNTPTRSPKTPETRINKGKNKENRIARGEPAGGRGGPGWMQVCDGFVGRGCRGKHVCRGVWNCLKTLKDFVIFGGFEDQ